MPEEINVPPQAGEPEPDSPLGGFFFHQRKAVEAAFKAIGALIPPDFKQYSAEARKEWLKSFGVLIEGAASSIERELNRVRRMQPDQPSEGEDKGPSTTGKSKVKVEVS